MIGSLLPNACPRYEWPKQQQSVIADELGFQPDLTSHGSSNSMGHSVCLLNKLGYIPVVSTFTGTYRTTVGISYFVYSLFALIANTVKGDSSLKEKNIISLKIAAANIERGVVEIIPVIGNLLAANFDVSRMMSRWTKVSGKPYGDHNSIPILNNIVQLGLIPIVGRVISLVRTLFYTSHFIVGLATLNGQAARYGLKEMGWGIVDTVPVVGLLTSARAITCGGTYGI